MNSAFSLVCQWSAVMAIVIGSAAWAIGSADRKHTESAILFRACLLTSVFMTSAYGPGAHSGELKVTRRTGVLRSDPGHCGLVPGDVRNAPSLIQRKKGMSSFHSQLTQLSPYLCGPRSHLTTVLRNAARDEMRFA